MPTRYLRPGIRDSELIDKLTPLAETLFYRLLVTVDDFGRADARPAMVKAHCYPIKDTVTADACKALLIELHRAQLIHLYAGPDAKPYLQMEKWANAPRAAESRFPAPVRKGTQMHASAGGPRTDLPVTVTGTGTGTEGGSPPEAAPATLSTGSKARKANAKFRPERVLLPTWLDQDDWIRWCADRRKRGKPITEEAARLQIEQLEGYRAEGHEPKAVIDHSIAGGYQGLFPKKVAPGSLQPIGEPKAWHETADGVVERGAELGIKWSGQPWERGDNAYPEWTEFKAAVLEAAGGTEA